nr:M13 family metallopeptidase [Lacticaseibacillus thailandensis]
MAAKSSFKDDLYLAVNGEWEATAVIPDDKPTTGGFSDLADGVEKHLMADFAAFRDGQATPPNELIQRATDLYRIAGDFGRRDQEGMDPLTPRLAKIERLASLTALNQQAADWDRDGLPLPFNIGIEPDMKDTAKNAVYLYALPTILPDTTYYAEDNPAKQPLLAAYRQTAAGLLSHTNLDDDTQSAYIEATLRFDATIAVHVKSNEDKADYPSQYNPQDRATVAQKMAPFAWDEYLQDLLPSEPQQIIVTDPGFLDAFASIYNDDTFTDFRAWAYVNELLSDASYLSEELRQVAGTYRRALTGLSALPNQDKSAYRIANQVFSEPIGIYYGRKYFGEAAKADVTKLVQRMIATYKQRISDNAWMSQPTKDKAIVKLNTMVLKMGYPDKANERYDHFQVDKDASLLTNLLAIHRAGAAYAVAQLDQPLIAGSGACLDNW